MYREMTMRSASELADVVWVWPPAVGLVGCSEGDSSCTGCEGIAAWRSLAVLRVNGCAPLHGGGGGVRRRGRCCAKECDEEVSLGLASQQSQQPPSPQGRVQIQRGRA